jgi:hypothetical protein
MLTSSTRNLLAKATATTFWCVRASSCANQQPEPWSWLVSALQYAWCPLNEQSS